MYYTTQQQKKNCQGCNILGLNTKLSRIEHPRTQCQHAFTIYIQYTTRNPISKLFQAYKLPRIKHPWTQYPNAQHNYKSIHKIHFNTYNNSNYIHTTFQTYRASNILLIEQRHETQRMQWECQALRTNFFQFVVNEILKSVNGT